MNETKTDYNKSEILNARDISFMSYKIKGQKEEFSKYFNRFIKRTGSENLSLKRFEKIYPNQAQSLAGCIIETNDSIYVSFKGTSQTNTDEIYNDNLAALADFNIQTENSSYACKAHEGFLNEYNYAKNQVYEILNDLPPESRQKNIIACGHSLGGAMASIFALEYNLNNPENPVKCITFGAPKVFERKTAKLFNDNVECFRVIDVLDPVKNFPALRMGYAHAGKEILTDRGHKIVGHSMPDTYDKLIKATPAIQHSQSFNNLNVLSSLKASVRRHTL